MAKRSKKANKKTGAIPPKAAAASQGFPAWFSNKRAVAWGLFALSFLLYANTLTHDYALDDAIVIYNNMFVEDGVSGIPGILSKDTFYGFFREEGKASLVAGGRYRPLTLVLFALEVQLFGKTPFVGHLSNGLLYGLTTAVLYLLLLKIFNASEGKPQAFFIPLAAGVLFAVHPIHTEVVANIKGCDEIVALLGSLAALYYSFRAYRENRPAWNVIAGLVFFLGLMSKENAITFLAVTPLAYYCFTKASPGVIVHQAAPFVVAAAVFLAIRFSVLGFSLSEPTMEMMNNPFIKAEGGQYLPFTAEERFATVFYTLGKYILLLFFPIVLTHDYYPRQIGVMDFGDWSVWLSLVVYAAMLVYALRKLPKRDPVSFALLYYLATLSIVSNLFFPVGTHMAERLMFMPSVGYCLLLAILGYRWAVARKPKGKAPAFRQFTPVLGLLLVVALAYSVRTVLRNPAWKDNYTLFTTDIRHSPNSAKLRNAVGGELVTQSLSVQDPARKAAMLNQAIQHLKEALRIHPAYKNAYLLLGNAYNYLQQYENAIEAYKNALALDPDYSEARRNLGITYKDAGKYFGEQKRDLNQAILYLNQAREILPNEYEVLRLLGVAHGIKGDREKAVEYFTLATQADPAKARGWYDLGTAYLNLGNTELGQQYRRKAYEMDPGLKAEMDKE
ncbi:MAG: tetratricopeptide repeat protein [Lewinellaceae bacterium]|nr:tetratricopeptide repeat protein [Lewinellaceae bacterium]MCB9285919.1 tetratricopeptide repeat protein [Lewinellaceae bacterium]